MHYHGTLLPLARERAEPTHQNAEYNESMEYSITVWRTPIREYKEVLYRLTYHREWMPERSCWREFVVRQERCEEC
jgi:hypothetical protein